MTPADRVVFVLAFALLPLLYLHYWHRGDAGQTVRIFVDGHPAQTVTLDRDRRITVHGRLGDSVLEISHGAVRFIASPCTGKYCIHAGWLHDSGEFAACLPNRVSIEVMGGSEGYDAINF